MGAAERVRVVILGGSSVGTPALIPALQRHGTPPRPLELVLHGRSRDKLAPVAHVAQIMARGCDWLSVRAETDLERALAGADIVLNQIRVGGLRARAFDETFPQQFGIPGEETVGPGGYANAMRTVPALVQIAQTVERSSPDALLLTFTNPASVIQYAIARTTRLRVIGLCDGAITMTAWAAAALGLPADALRIDYVGMHHYGFITRVWHDGRDVTAAMLAGLDGVSALEMDTDIVRSLGALPTPYFKYFLHPDRMLAKQRGKPSRAEQLLSIEADLLGEYAAAAEPPPGLVRRGAKWYDAIIAPVLMALVTGERRTFVLNVPNGDLVPWLPPDAIVETPCALDAGTIRPLAMPTPGRELVARIQHNCAYEQAMVEAFLEQSEVKSLRALALSPLVPNADTARQIIRLIFPDADPERLGWNP
jgi:6-phospho-beta-glucosidase